MRRANTPATSTAGRTAEWARRGGQVEAGHVEGGLMLIGPSPKLHEIRGILSNLNGQ
ncbi:hypothetical protein MDOR_39620 [Mycolicibacterium doricum]|uniref:Uncharacterized protein n=1 Tax=Mycolicibacterium doricum TaxID=126673 RepID=A0A7I7W092_9MYCO|nr:hypothetical protein MDOR_39620 [Mycolicibacterium doricum]